MYLLDWSMDMQKDISSNFIRKHIIHGLVLVVALLVVFVLVNNLGDKSTEDFYYLDTTKPTYTITPTTLPCNSNYISYTTYNSYTKQYFMIRSYIEKLEKTSGGTLIFKKGIYKIPVNLFISSGITFVFEDGVYIKKTSVTGTTKMSHSDNLFQMISHSKSKIVGSVGKYEGTRDVTFVGAGSVVIDMGYHTAGCAIIMGHNYNMRFSGITFTNGAGHFFELDASKNVVIENCTFKNIQGSISEAINVDTPDRNTGGFTFKWSKMDRTPNDNVLIKKCNFDNMPRAIGTHKYSMTDSGLPIYHNNIRVIYNKMTRIQDISVRPLNWSNSLIAVNTISGPGKEIYKYAMLAGGISNVTIRDNSFSNYYRIIAIRPAQNSGSGSLYPPTYNKLSTDNLDTLKTNKCQAASVTESLVRINSTLDLSDKAKTISLLLY